MSIWEKKTIAPEVVKEIHERYSCDLLTASILARRSISGNELLFYLEDDPRFLHNPFLFSAMEDAVDRIWAAKEEGEKVLIFGDRDVDGITSTVILYDCLKEMGIDVAWRIPTGDDPYGLTAEAVDKFAADYGTLIITVDCGISNTEEIARAAAAGIDVIIVDHHNPPEKLPAPAIIINPKLAESGYPFSALSGCGVTYKLISALRFSRNELYKQEICLLNVRPVNEAYAVECVKIVNMTETARLCETIVPDTVSIRETRLIPFLQGQQILVWDEPLQKKLLAKVFGGGVEFNMLDIRNEIEKTLPGVRGQSLIRLSAFSKIAKYSGAAASELDAFFNLFVTFVQKKTAAFAPQDEQDLQLVMLATLADLMPLKNENRILIRLGLASLNAGKARPGLMNLLAKQNMLGKKTGTTDLSWNIIPALNAAGRLGQPELAVRLFLEENPPAQDDLASQILQLNRDRKQIGSDSWTLIESQAYKSLEEHANKLIIVADERVHRGITGILANKLAQCFKVPSIVVTFLEEGNAVGSVRSTRGFDVTGMLEQCADLFISHGGHAYAAGFSLEKKNMDEFLRRMKGLAQVIEFSEGEEEPLVIDAELPHSYLTPDLLKLIDKFEPYGEGNAQLQFTAKKLKITAADLLGKTERQHLKLTLNCGKHQWPALYWGEGERLKRDFDIGDTVDAVFQIGRNTYNGTETAQMILSDVVKC